MMSISSIFVVFRLVLFMYKGLIYVRLLLRLLVKHAEIQCQSHLSHMGSISLRNFVFKAKVRLG